MRGKVLVRSYRKEFNPIGKNSFLFRPSLPI
jgi:hypothetical protein